MMFNEFINDLERWNDSITKKSVEGTKLYTCTEPEVTVENIKET